MRELVRIKFKFHIYIKMLLLRISFRFRIIIMIIYFITHLRYHLFREIKNALLNEFKTVKFLKCSN